MASLFIYNIPRKLYYMYICIVSLQYSICASSIYLWTAFKKKGCFYLIYLLFFLGGGIQYVPRTENVHGFILKYCLNISIFPEFSLPNMTKTVWAEKELKELRTKTYCKDRLYFQPVVVLFVLRNLVLMTFYTSERYN